jgi:hypothetical protein
MSSRGESKEELRVLDDKKTLKIYLSELVRLLFNCIEQAGGKTATNYYPLTVDQKNALLSLHAHFRGQPEAVAPLLHRSLFLLFAHEKDHGGVSNFKLSVVCYLVARSMGESEWKRTSEIGRYVAQLMWATRGIVLYEMEGVMSAEKLGSAEYVSHTSS